MILHVLARTVSALIVITALSAVYWSGMRRNCARCPVTHCGKCPCCPNSG